MSMLSKSSIDAWMAVPKEAAMPAFRGKPWRLNQYMRGQVSYLFHDEGESRWASAMRVLSAQAS